MFFLLLSFSLCRGDIYRYVDENGGVHFSDYPKHSGYKLYMRTRRGSGSSGAFLPGTGWMLKYAERVAVREGVDPNLVKAVIKAESNFRHQAVSSKGARGVMQLLPQTFPDAQREDLMDPVRNIELGVKHLKKLLKRFGGNATLAVAAYNAGAGSVEKYGGVPPFEETMEYVERVMEFYSELRGNR